MILSFGVSFVTFYIFVYEVKYILLKISITACTITVFDKLRHAWFGKQNYFFYSLRSNLNYILNYLKIKKEKEFQFQIATRKAESEEMTTFMNSITYGLSSIEVKVFFSGTIEVEY